MTEPTTTPVPFSFNDWFAGKSAPERSADIFTENELLGDLGLLKREITTIQTAIKNQGGDSDVDDEVALSAAMAKYQALLERFHASKRTFWMRALTSPERKALDAEHTEAKTANEDFICFILAKSIVGVAKPGDEKTPVTMTLEDVRKLYSLIGDYQLTQLHDAYRYATYAEAEVDADFLSPSSSAQEDDE